VHKIYKPHCKKPKLLESFYSRCRIPTDMKSGLSFILLLLLGLLCACSTKQESPDDVRERAAKATAEIKRDTKAVAEGIREGWSRDKPLDINAASKEQLQLLPGVTPKLADNIISHRPYAKTSDLVEKHVMSKPEYEKVADQLAVK
jgi:hypothetical protein